MTKHVRQTGRRIVKTVLLQYIYTKLYACVYVRVITGIVSNTELLLRKPFTRETPPPKHLHEEIRRSTVKGRRVILYWVYK